MGAKFSPPRARKQFNTSDDTAGQALVQFRLFAKRQKSLREYLHGMLRTIAVRRVQYVQRHARLLLFTASFLLATYEKQFMILNVTSKKKQRGI